MHSKGCSPTIRACVMNSEGDASLSQQSSRMFQHAPALAYHASIETNPLFSEKQNKLYVEYIRCDASPLHCLFVEVQACFF